MIKYNLIIALLIVSLTAHSQHFEKLGNGLIIKTFNHPQGIDFNLSETDAQDNIYHLFYDTVTNGFNYGKEYIQVRLQIFDGVSWLFSKPIKLYSKRDVLAPRILDVQYYNFAIYIAGSFDSSENNIGGGIVKFENKSWQGINLKPINTSGAPILINKLFGFGNNLMATGDFDSIPGTKVNGISIYNGSIWQALGSAKFIGFNGANNFNNTYFEVAKDSLYVYKKNNNGADTIVVGNAHIYKIGVLRGNRFVSLAPPTNKISSLLAYQNNLAALELSPLFYTRYLSIKKVSGWQRYVLPDSFYSINYIGNLEIGNKLYLLVENPNAVMLDIYEFDGTVIQKKQSWKIADNYINLNLCKTKNEFILSGNFNKVSHGTYSDSFKYIAKINLTNFALIAGITYLDANNDGIKQSTEKSISNCIIYDATNKLTTMSNSQGIYAFKVPLIQNYNISATNNIGYSTSFSASFYPTTDSLLIYDIGFTDKNSNDLSVNIFSNTGNKAKQGFIVTYKIQVLNTSAIDQNTNIKINMSKGFTTLMSQFNLLSQTSTGFLFNTDIKAHRTQNYTFSCIYPVDSFILGEKISISAILNTSDDNLNNNSDTLKQTIVSAYDPNVKFASPSEIVTKEKTIRYTIYYQNEGNDIATNVTIIDTLSALFNTTQIYPDNIQNFELANGVLIWRLQNIQLPPKKIDSAGSIGFVSFAIRLGAGAKIGDTVLNKASIYFDYQKPVFTNKAQIIFSKSSSLSNLNYFNKFKIYPNPTKDVFYYENTTHLNGDLLLTDISGKIILKVKLEENGTVLIPQNIANGIYLLQFSGERNAHIGKLIIIN